MRIIIAFKCDIVVKGTKSLGQITVKLFLLIWYYLWKYCFFNHRCSFGCLLAGTGLISYWSSWPRLQIVATIKKYTQICTLNACSFSRFSRHQTKLHTLLQNGIFAALSVMVWSQLVSTTEGTSWPIMVPSHEVLFNVFTKIVHTVDTTYYCWVRMAWSDILLSELRWFFEFKTTAVQKCIRGMIICQIRI